MSSSDGYISGTHKIVDHGPNSQRYNIVILGDGYRASELAQFATDVDNFVNTLRSTAPYNDLWCAINVHRVDVVSTDSGADDPGTCGDGSTGSGATPKTYFDATFCGDGNIRRLLTCDSTSAKNVAQAQVPEVHMAMVIVNSSEYGGSGGEVATFSTNASSAEIGLHEMGHTAFGFADEYEYWSGCGSGETGHDSYSGSEPSQPNITANTNKTTIKWNAQLTNSADALPTTANADCTKCDTQANPKAASYVGAYEGAGYFHCKLYRPQYTCRMRALNNPFCAVCQSVITNTLAPFKPAESLTLTTPSIAFSNIPEGLGGIGVTTYRAIVFEVITCATRTFRITAGPTGGFGTPLGTVVSVSANDADPVAEARLWLSYTSTTAGSTSSGTVTVRCDETGQTWVINIVANTVARPKSAVTFVLDHSGSMSEDAGDGTTKVGKLREAANIFVSAMLQGDGLGIVRFDDTAQILMPVTDVGPPIIGAGRATAIGHISGSELDPAGNTSIGAGVVSGKQTLDDAQAAASPVYDVTAMLVLTDGMENTPPMLSSVGSSITANTFAIGLGKPENISVAALNTLTQGHSGYLLVTGTLTPSQAARLDKYFLQILAGVTNANVVLDPHGDLTIGATHRIPFMVSDTDFGLDVFLITPYSPYVDFELETPDGTRITPATSGGPSNASYIPTAELAYYRLSLPALPADAAGTHSGKWNAVLTIASRRGEISREFLSAAAAFKTGSLPYDLVVHCYSNLLFTAHAQQTSFEPGATVFLTASLREYDVPVEKRANAWVQVTRPDASTFTLKLPESEPGRFEGSFVASLTGLYTMRVRTVGATFRGVAFEREQTLTAAAYPGGDRVTPEGGGVQFWCEALECLLSDRALAKKLRELGLDLRTFTRCLAKHCAAARPPQEGRTTPTTQLSEHEIHMLVERVVNELRSNE
jgi:IgA Peptidase M64/von Willebrand factor type A domain